MWDKRTGVSGLFHTLLLVQPREARPLAQAHTAKEEEQHGRERGSATGQPAGDATLGDPR